MLKFNAVYIEKILKALGQQGNFKFPQLETVHKNFVTPEKYHQLYRYCIRIQDKERVKEEKIEEILKNVACWIEEGKNVKKTDNNHHAQPMLLIPLLASGNAGGFREIIESAVCNYNDYGMNGQLSNAAYVRSKDMSLTYLREKHDLPEWKEFWKSVVLCAMGHAYQTLEELEEELNRKKIKVIFLIDGLEEIFQHTNSDENERNAITALCRDFVDEVKITYRNFGFIVFLIKDMARRFKSYGGSN